MIGRVVKPLFPYLGGKARLLEEVVNRTPSFDNINNYVEPCIGAGSYGLWLLANHKDKFDSIVFNDRSKEIMVLYEVVRDYVEEFILLAKEYEFGMSYLYSARNDRKVAFYRIRGELNELVSKELLSKEDKVELAVKFIFIMKSVFGSYYRRNSKGLSNCSFGKMPSELVDVDNVRYISSLLEGVILSNVSIADLDIKENSFIYIDPPYLSVSKSGMGYFKDDTKEELQDSIFSKLDSLVRCKWLLSNSNHVYFRYKYQEYIIREVKIKQNAQPKKEDRKLINELLISNYR